MNRRATRTAKIWLKLDHHFTFNQDIKKLLWTCCQQQVAWTSKNIVKALGLILFLHQSWQKFMAKTLKIATWNVNSIRSRLTHVIDWLRANNPDVLCLQETKVQDAEFPTEPLEDLGYTVTYWGQKSYNGVAILSVAEPAQVQRGLPDDEPDAQRRFLAATIEGIRILCAYVPNGGDSPKLPKFEYKMQFLYHLEQYFTETYRPNDALLLCGDFNIAPGDLDLFEPDNYRETVMFHSREHAFLNRWLEWGLVDLVRQQHPQESGLYTWWDYRTTAFPRNRGWRIDHIWVTQPLVERCLATSIHRDERGKDKPSDHVPVMAEFSL